ncbi:MAG: hypothetical protein WD801_12520 [Gemmatimonadaceae bacterium]
MTEPAAVPATVASPVRSLRVLLQGVVDYAGLFPPASLAMSAAVAEYAGHRAAATAWALGRFVLPAARLEEFEAAADGVLPREGARSWAMSALGASDLEEDIERIERFNARHANVRDGAVLVDTVEIKTHSPRDVTRAGELLDRRFDTYMEVPVEDDPAELIAAISRTRCKAKIRTGGVTPDAFPTSAQVLRFAARCIAHGVSFKATAGLHHPWRDEYRLTYAREAPVGTMFGFLNMLLAVAALHAGLGEEHAIRLLEERDASSVEFGHDGVRWRDASLPFQAVQRARETMSTFGSCSFREPIADLQAIHLL